MPNNTGMTRDERNQLRKDVLYLAYEAAEEAAAQRAKMEIAGERLESIGRALRKHPELVTSLPEPGNPDYREALREPLIDSQALLEMCNEFRELEQRRRNAEKRKGLVINGSVQNLDS